jgi:hypothetical protein
MNEQEQKKLADALQQSCAPLDRELKRDLWPQMLRRCEQDSANRTWFAALFLGSALASVPWFDWALLAALLVGACIFPKSIPIWLYHF